MYLLANTVHRVSFLSLLGTVQGGTQLQEFKSVGVRLFDFNSKLNLPHNSSVYISVVAVNGAGLRTISYSDPLLVDLTPPVFEYVYDGFIDGRLAAVISWTINVKVMTFELPVYACVRVCVCACYKVKCGT